MKKGQQYDFIFAGAGAATLQVVERLVQMEHFANVSILILEQDANKNNDRTWCFWEDKNKTKWAPHIIKEWEYVNFNSTSFSLHKTIRPLAYKMMRSDSYYTAVKALIEQNGNITISYEAVTSFDEYQGGVTVNTAENSYRARLFFNSIFDWNIVQQQKRYPVLQQHFLGWFIKTDQPTFDENTATFMDFTIAQKGNTRFMYVLPLSPTEALVEYTLFSKKRLQHAAYERELRAYLTEKNIRGVTIKETEKGSIPMTCYPFAKHNSKHVLHIGSAGGWTKPSTGFTFAFIEQKSAALVDFLKTNNDMRLFEKRTRFWWYDLVFLDVLARHNDKGSFLFGRMFEHNTPATIFSFLEEKSTFGEELQIMRSFPMGLFIRQIFRRLLGAFH